MILCGGFAAWLLLCRAAAFTPSEPGLYAVFNTSLGEFTAKLEFEKVPMTVASFVGLAEGTIASFDLETNEPKLSKYFDGIIFHRVVNNFVIQGGDPLGTGTGGPGYRFPDEIDISLPHTGEGVLSMANSGANTNGSQFFITLASANALDGKHSVFGQVIEGLDVVNAIEAVPVQTDPQNPQNPNKPVVDVVINSVTIVREGPAAEAFDPTAWKVPSLETAPSQFVFAEDSRRLVFERNLNTEYHVFDSLDLASWNKTAQYAPEPTQQLPVALDFTGSLDSVGKRFFQVARTAGTVEIDQFDRRFVVPNGIDKSGTRILITLGTNPQFDFTFTSPTQGTYVFDATNGAISSYEWFEVGKLIQLFVTLDGLSPSQIQFYFDPNAVSGSVFARARETSPGANNGFNLSGTFQIP